jgi:hypothetical protein
MTHAYMQIEFTSVVSMKKLIFAEKITNIADNYDKKREIFYSILQGNQIGLSFSEEFDVILKF